MTAPHDHSFPFPPATDAQLQALQEVLLQFAQNSKAAFEALAAHLCRVEQLLITQHQESLKLQRKQAREIRAEMRLVLWTSLLSAATGGLAAYFAHGARTDADRAQRRISRAVREVPAVLDRIDGVGTLVRQHDTRMRTVLGRAAGVDVSTDQTPRSSSGVPVLH